MSRAVLIAIIGFATAAAALGLAMSLDSDDDSRRSIALPVAVEAGPPSNPTAQMPALPAFDVVRIGRNGDAVLAGRAQPKAEIILLDGEHELGRAMADERGEWVFVPTLPLAPGSRSLTAEAHNSDGTVLRTAQPVVVAVPENMAEPAAPPPANDDPRPTATPSGDGDPITVDLVDRDPSGRLFMGGRAQRGALIHLYMDNTFLGRVQADAEGGWRLAIIAAQGQLLRADLVDEDGKVRARLEAPLEPEPDQLEPGAAQWKVGRPDLGAPEPGSTVIYSPSKDRMRDPDRVYPGQVFRAVTKK